MVKVGEKYRHIDGDLSGKRYIITGRTDNPPHPYQVFNIDDERSGVVSEEYATKECDFLGLAELSGVLAVNVAFNIGGTILQQLNCSTNFRKQLPRV